MTNQAATQGAKFLRPLGIFNAADEILVVIICDANLKEKKGWDKDGQKETKQFFLRVDCRDSPLNRRTTSDPLFSSKSSMDTTTSSLQQNFLWFPFF